MRYFLTLLSLVIGHWPASHRGDSRVGWSLVTSVPASQPYTPIKPDPVAESWRWRTFPELKGLGLRAMEEDRDGNIWFGVEKRDNLHHHHPVNVSAIAAPGFGRTNSEFIPSEAEGSRE